MTYQQYQMPTQPPLMPGGIPPYPVTFKEFFITDPKTGKQTVRVQMYPVVNETSDNDESEDESNDIDDDASSNSFFANWLDNYYQFGDMYDHHPVYDESYNVGPIHYEANYKHYPGVGVQTAHAEIIHDAAHPDLHFYEHFGDDDGSHDHAYLDHRSPSHHGYQDQEYYLDVRPAHDHGHPFEHQLFDSHMQRTMVQEKHALDEIRHSWHEGQDPVFSPEFDALQHSSAYYGAEYGHPFGEETLAGYHHGPIDDHYY